MKRTNNIATRYILLAASLVLTCIIVSIGMYQMKEARQITSTVNKEINSINTDLTENSIVMYDGLEVKGSDVINFYKKNLLSYQSGETAPFSMTITLKSGTNTYYNGTSLELLKNSVNSQYVKPTWSFIGKVTRNENDVITNISFTQN